MGADNKLDFAVLNKENKCIKHICRWTHKLIE